MTLSPWREGTTSLTRHHIVTLARAWIGMPYHHQASARGVGTDCIGLIRGISLNYFSGEPVSRAEARELGDAWAPFRSVATWYIWRSLDPLPVDY